MKKFFYLLSILFLSAPFVRVQAQAPPTFGWANGIAMVQLPLTGPAPVQQVIDASGNVYMAGFFSGTHDFDPGPGTFLLSSSMPEVCIFILKLDSAGNFLWAKAIDDEHPSGTESSWLQYGVPIALDADGNVYVASFFSGNVDIDPGPGTYFLNSVNTESAAFILKLDSDGNFQWAKNTGSETPNAAKILPTAIVVDNSGSIYITGLFSGSVDFDPGPGAFSATASGSRDAFVLKMDVEGQFIWAKTMGGVSASALGNSIALTSSGEILLCGIYYKAAIDADPGAGIFNLGVGTSGNSISCTFLLKLNTAGDFLWAKSWSGDRSIAGYSLKLNASGEIYMAGGFERNIDFDPGPGVYNLYGGEVNEDDLYILKLSADGEFEWVKNWHGSLFIINKATGSLALDSFGNLYLAGSFVSTLGPIDFDPGPDALMLSANGNVYEDLFLLSLNADGDFRWVNTLGGPGRDASTFVILDKTGNIYLSGSYNNTVDFDPGSGQYYLPVDHVFNGLNDAFITKWQQQTTPVEDINEQEASIYPNPVKDVFSIQLKEKPLNLHVEIYARDGKLIQQQNNANPNVISIPSEAPAGVYFVHFKDDRGLNTAWKVVKE